MKGTFIDTPIRQLTVQDVPAVIGLSASAGWNQTAADWMLLMGLHPEGCLAIECDEQVVATATLICYGDQVAWLGMVLTHPAYRQRGFARRLVQSALSIAEARKVQSVKLDATDQGRRLYESFGFREAGSVERWLRVEGTPSGLSVDAHLGMPDVKLDREAFGADRSKVLALLTADSLPFITDDGYGMSRIGAHTSYFGPCVARSDYSAKRIIESCLSVGGRRWYWDLFPSNQPAVAIAESLNFKVERRLIRMVKGPDVRGNDSMIYAGSGFELG